LLVEDLGAAVGMPLLDRRIVFGPDLRWDLVESAERLDETLEIGRPRHHGTAMSSSIGAGWRCRRGGVLIGEGFEGVHASLSLAFSATAATSIASASLMTISGGFRSALTTSAKLSPSCR
jgi:hypothetical protein